MLWSDIIFGSNVFSSVCFNHIQLYCLYHPEKQNKTNTQTNKQLLFVQSAPAKEYYGAFRQDLLLVVGEYKQARSCSPWRLKNVGLLLTCGFPIICDQLACSRPLNSSRWAKSITKRKTNVIVRLAILAVTGWGLLHFQIHPSPAGTIPVGEVLRKWSFLRKCSEICSDTETYIPQKM